METEAYRGPEDRASHAYGGRRTRRTETMYARGGTAYVYFVYGMYHQFNVVTNVADVPHAVLVRALEPVEGVALMRRRRGGVAPGELTSGPGKLCIALGIDRRLDRADLLGDRIWLEVGPARLAGRDRGRPAGRHRLRGGLGRAAVALLAARQPVREPRPAAARQTRRRRPLRSSAHMSAHQSSTYTSA